MTNYRRLRVPGGTYFFTVNCATRQNTSLLTDNIDLLRDCFRKVKRSHPFIIEAIVILPDHLHCIWTLPQHDSDFSKRWFLIKSNFSRAIPLGEERTNSRWKKGERGLWQRRFWEHVISDQRDFQNHIDYIHFNPLKHGLVDCVSSWPYSSFHSFVRSGVYPENWAGPG